MPIPRIIGILLIVAGVLLLVFGLQATDSIGEKLSNGFTGKYTRETMAMIVSGAVAAVAGVLLTIFGARKR